MLQAPGTGSSSLKTAANRARKTCASLFTTPLGVTLNKVWRKHTVSCIVFPLVILVIATVVATYHLRASRPPVEAGELIGTSSLINALIVAAYNSIMKQRDTTIWCIALPATKNQIDICIGSTYPSCIYYLDPDLFGAFDSQASCHCVDIMFD